MDLDLGRWIYMVLKQHPRIEVQSETNIMVLRQNPRIDLSLLQHRSTSEEKHGRLLKRGSGDCRTFLCSVTQAANGS